MLGSGCMSSVDLQLGQNKVALALMRVEDGCETGTKKCRAQLRVKGWTSSWDKKKGRRSVAGRGWTYN